MKYRCSFVCAVAMLMSILNTVYAADEFVRYEVRRTMDTIKIDGVLDESSWLHADTTEDFVIYFDGSTPLYPAAGQLLWDDENLYVAMTMYDADIRGTFTEHDDHLYKEDVAEIFLDPDGDGLNYIELEIGPLGTLMDIVMSSAYREGGSSDWDWNLAGFNAAIHIAGTINDGSDRDTMWIVECSLPFDGLAFSAPDMQFPPVDGDTWRLNLYRYNYPVIQLTQHK